MEAGRPSRTAWAAAAHRAVHQVLEGGRIFRDPLAVRILGADADDLAREAEARPGSHRMRMFIAVRTRFAEDAVANAIARGLRQVVVLGAGLDTYAYRASLPPGLRVFEVDYPATQAWKRGRLEESGIAVPDALTFAPVDFERQTLEEGLASAGFDPLQATFFTWLGVVPYLTKEAVWSTLGFIGGLPGGAQVVFDYSDPPETLTEEARRYHDTRAARVGALGEAWVSYFEPRQLQARLSALGFGEVEDLGPPEIAARYFPRRAGAAPERGGHILRAAAGPHG